MPYIVDFSTVSTVGLESSPVAAALTGLRANEARYFTNKNDHVFTVEPARDAQATLAQLASKFKFARQKPKLAGTIRGSFFTIKTEY